MKFKLTFALPLLLILFINCDQKPHYDTLIRNGYVVDGSGDQGIVTDLAIAGDSIVAIGDMKNATADREIDARGLVVAPGFINMLSWAVEDLIADGNSQSDIRQGVTLEVFGEGMSMGPLTPETKERFARQQGDIKYDINWTSLNEYLEYLEN